MAKLEVKKIGPLVDLKLTLNRFDVFIGKQSSGKSTLAKIISHCLWMEKEVATHPYNDIIDYEIAFRENLEEFHNMKGYFNKDSYIKYESDVVTISLEGTNCSIKKKKNKYHRNKILYIPAERNIVVYSDSIGGANNLKSFSTDWQIARDVFGEDNKQDILNLDINYYYENENGKKVNRIDSHEDGKTYAINLNQGSSGLQSVIPITVTMDFFTDIFYDPKVAENLRKSNEKYDTKKLLDYLIQQRSGEVTGKMILDVLDSISGITSTRQTCFVIEEPEINIFPETQEALLNYIVSCCNRREKRHSVTLTTHSPYILAAINNLLLAGKLVQFENLTKQVEMVTGGVYIDPHDLSVYAIENGRLQSLKDSDTGLISENYLDSVSDVIAGRFNELYKLYIGELRRQ
ncbi:MAG: ATP-binding protein [Prevotella sp.]|nr:ATP-binding protein [Prevotella sp.]